MQRQVLGYVSQLQLIYQVVYTPVVAQCLVPIAFLFETIEILDVLVALVVRVPTVGEETVALSQLQLPRTSRDVVNIPVLAQRQFPMVLRTIEIPQFHFDKVIGVRVVQVEQVPLVPSWRGQSCSHGCTC